MALTNEEQKFKRHVMAAKREIESAAKMASENLGLMDAKVFDREGEGPSDARWLLHDLCQTIAEMEQRQIPRGSTLTWPGRYTPPPWMEAARN